MGYLDVLYIFIFLGPLSLDPDQIRLKAKYPRSNPTWASIASNGAGDGEDPGADGSAYADENKLKETQPSSKTISGTCTDASGIGIEGFTDAQKSDHHEREDEEDG